MNIYKVLHVLVLFCVISQGLAWFGRSRARSSRKSTIRKSSSSSKSSPSDSSKRGSGWWGGGRKTPSEPSNKPKQEPKKTSEPKPKSTGWFFGKRKKAPMKPETKPKPQPKKSPEPKPKSTGWFFGKKKVAQPKLEQKSKPEPKKTLETKRKSTGWFSGKKKVVPSKPKPKPKPKPKTKPYLKPKSTRWFWGKKKVAVPKPEPKPTPEPKMTTEPKPKSTAKPFLEQKPATSPIPQQKPAVKPEQDTQSETDMEQKIEEYEGMRLEAYDAMPENKNVHDTTIGIGFNLNRPDAKETFEDVLPGVDFNKVKSGEQSITEEQARALFHHDVDNIYVPRARNMVGKEVYDKLPSNVKTALVNAVYRGDLGTDTAKLIKQGKWKEVGKVYLDHYQYKNAEELGIPGVKPRMDWNKKQFDTMIMITSESNTALKTRTTAIHVYHNE